MFELLVIFFIPQEKERSISLIIEYSHSLKLLIYQYVLEVLKAIKFAISQAKLT